MLFLSGFLTASAAHSLEALLHTLFDLYFSYLKMKLLEGLKGISCSFPHSRRLCPAHSTTAHSLNWKLLWASH